MSPAQRGFELRDHTADIALFSWGATAKHLFSAAADGLYAACGDAAKSSRFNPEIGWGCAETP